MESKAYYPADLPPCCLRLMKSQFYLTGVDCLGPFQVKRGQSTEKRWGIVYKCMTTRCVHLDVLYNMDIDLFLNVAQMVCGLTRNPLELLSDQLLGWASAPGKFPGHE